MLIQGIVSTFLLNELLLPQIFIVVGIEILVVTFIRSYVFKKCSIKLLGIIISLFSIVNFLRHSVFFMVISRINEVFDSDSYFSNFLLKEITWLIPSTWIVFQAIRLIGNSRAYVFNHYVKSFKFRILSVIILILLVLEIPVFGIHGDFGGGLHGHSFWDGGTHLH